MNAARGACISAAAMECLELRFWREIWKAAPLDAVQEVGVEMHWFGPLLATVFAHLPEAPLLNVLRGAAEPGPGEQGYLAEAVDWIQGWGVDFSLPVAAGRPGSRQTEEWLSWHGFEQRDVSRKFVRQAVDPGWPDAPDVEVVELEPNDTEGTSLLIGEGWELPDFSTFLFCSLPAIGDWHCYSAFLDGYEVACGSMFLCDGVAVLGLDATAKEARRRGCHRALLRRRLADAAAAGCRWVFASAFDEFGTEGPAAAASLRKAGFVEAHRSVSWRQPLCSRPRGSHALWL